MKWKVLAVALLAGITPALSLEGAPLDGGAHPSVGHVFAQVSDPATCSAEVVTFCSATLISSSVAVTSGGCADLLLEAEEYGYELTAMWISFDEGGPYDCASASRIAELHYHPLFDEDSPGSPYDIGVMVLSAPVGIPPANLPAAGSQGGYDQHDAFETVGWAPDKGGHVFTYSRRAAPLVLRSEDADYLVLRTTQTGSSCATGLDGGGAFLEGSQNLVGLDNGNNAG